MHGSGRGCLKVVEMYDFFMHSLLWQKESSVETVTGIANPGA